MTARPWRQWVLRRTNADTPHDAEVARNFGAVGIGLCRTEHMFFENEKIKAMREMILADSGEGREAARLSTSLCRMICVVRRSWLRTWV